MSKRVRAKRRALTAAAVLPVVTALAAALFPASASGTRFWELTTRETLAEGKSFENVMLTAEGELRLGPATESIPIEGERQIWSLARARDGALYAGTATGKILRIEGGKVEIVFATEQLLVTDIVGGPDGLLYAATIPNGKIFRQDAAGRWAGFADLPCKYAWSLMPHAAKHLIAATGPDGKLFSIDAQGKSEVLFETGKENILSLARGNEGVLYFGTANPGLLFRLAPDGRASILRSFGDDEVRIIRVVKQGLALGINAGVKTTPASFLGAIRQAAQKAESKEGGPVASVPPPTAVPEKSASPSPATKPSSAASTPASSVRGYVTLLAMDGRLENQIDFPMSYITDLAATEAGLLVGTNNSGRVFRIDEAGKPTLIWDFPENQVLAFMADPGREVCIGTGDAASVRRAGGGPAPSGRYLSKSLDAGFRAEWGGLSWSGKGTLGFQARSGNVEEPDKTWSDWSPATIPPRPAGAPPAPPTGGTLKVASPPARYLQFRADWEADAAAAVSGVTIAYLPENQRPRVLEVKVSPARPPGQLPPAGGAPAQGQPAAPAALHSTLKKITWRAEDPDGDPLVFRLAFRPEDGMVWIPIHRDEPVGGTEFLWNTESVPDGRYIARVEASDENVNAGERALRRTFESASFTIDHQKPEVRLSVAWVGNACRVRGQAEDALSPIARMEYNVDGGDWKPVFPADGVFDERVESFEFSPHSLQAGARILTVRAIDREENIGSARVTVIVP